MAHNRNHNQSSATTEWLTTDAVLDPPRVSDLIGVPVATLAQWRYLGKGPAYLRLGRHCRYRLQDVEAWLLAHRHGGDAA